MVSNLVVGGVMETLGLYLSLILIWLVFFPESAGRWVARFTFGRDQMKGKLIDKVNDDKAKG